MDAAPDFAARLKQQLETARLKTRDRAQADETRMQERSERLAILEAFAERVHRELIRPRMEELARQFANASVEHVRTPGGFLTYAAFAHTAQYPATAKIGVGVEWSADAGDVGIVCHAEILPQLMAIEGPARLPLAWDSPNTPETVQWIEDRLFTFLECYLRIEHDPYYQLPNSHADPVCGMRVMPSESALVLDLEGKRYFFCSNTCRDDFAANAELYRTGRAPAFTGGERRRNVDRGVGASTDQ